MIFFSLQKAIKDTPAVPEDAEELSYKEICTKDQLKEMTRINNTWDIDYCPSPCEQNGPCPSGSQCIDLSTEIAPNHTCVCRMGLVMEGGRCIVRPPTTPVSNEVEPLDPQQKETAGVLTSSASFVLIGFVTGNHS